jgi:hypothetical protein
MIPIPKPVSRVSFQFARIIVANNPQMNARLVHAGLAIAESYRHLRFRCDYDNFVRSSDLRQPVRRELLLRFERLLFDE